MGVSTATEQAGRGMRRRAILTVSAILICTGFYVLDISTIGSNLLRNDEQQSQKHTISDRVGSGKAFGFKPKPSGSRATEEEIRELLSQPHRELERWKDGITLEMVERLYCVPEAIDTMRIQIVKGRPYLVGPNYSWQSRFLSMQKQVLDLAERFQLPDVDFIMSTADACKDWSEPPKSKDGKPDRCTRNAPLFSFCMHKYQDSCVTMPDFSTAGWPEAFMSNWQSTRAWLLLAAEHNPFKRRDPKLFWRGGGTNEQRNIMDYSGIVQDSGLTDVHLMHWGEGEDVFKQEFISLPEHCQHQQLLHLAGVSYSARLRALLLCGSPVVFPYDYDWEPKEFWYHMLKDRHNIMLTGKVTDQNWGENVVDIARELKSNPKLAQEVGERGQHLAAEILHPDNIQLYWLELLTQYSKLQKFKPKVHADATPLEIAVMKPQKGMLSKDRTCLVC